MDGKQFVYEEVSYRIIGCLYDVNNQLGSGLKEQVYQKAVSLKLAEDRFHFKEQVYIPIMYNGLIISSHCSWITNSKVWCTESNTADVFLFISATPLPILANRG